MEELLLIISYMMIGVMFGCINAIITEKLEDGKLTLFLIMWPVAVPIATCIHIYNYRHSINKYMYMCITRKIIQ
jgi:hypothetical protein